MVANKSDKLKSVERSLAALQSHTELPVLAVSAYTKAGVDELQAVLRKMCPVDPVW